MKTSIVTLLSVAYLSIFTLAAPSVSLRDGGVLESRKDLSIFSSTHDLEKRRGGGGGKGGSSSSSSSSSGTGSSSGSGARTGTGGSKPPSSYSYSTSSNLGGRTVAGSGQSPAYGNRYIGGAAVPYTAGSRTPTRGIGPVGLLPIAAISFFPGIWLYSAYAYPYGYPYYWNDNGRNRTSNVTCLCQEYSVCGCDDDGNQTTLQQMVTNNGTGAPVNSSTVRTVDYNNGSVTTYINGTLDNGTTAPGGTDPSDDSEISAAAKMMVNFGGYWLMIATVIAAVVWT